MAPTPQTLNSKNTLMIRLSQVINVVQRVIEASVEGVEAPALLFLGPPGIGKTTAIAEAAVRAAKRLGRRLVDLTGGEARVFAEAEGVEYVAPSATEELRRLYEDVRRSPDEYFVFLRLVATQMTPEDIQYPRVVDNIVVSMMPVKLGFLAVPGITGILFIDEITNVRREDAMTMYFSMVLERTVGLAGGLSSRVVVVAAGNRPEESSVASPLPAPLVNRFIIYNVAPPSGREVAMYIERYVKPAHPAVPAYLYTNPDDVYEAPESEETLEPFATPRSWAQLARMLALLGDTDESVIAATVEGTIGTRKAGRFLAWMKYRPPEPEKVMERPEILKSLDFEPKMIEIVLLSRYLARRWDDEEKKGRIDKLFNVLAEERELLVTLAALLAARSAKLLARLWKVAKRHGMLKEYLQTKAGLVEAAEELQKVLA